MKDRLKRPVRLPQDLQRGRFEREHAINQRVADRPRSARDE